MKELTTKLANIQATLKAPKDLHNKFGDYRYRSAESILEAVKPLLNANGLILIISDRIIDVGGRIYVNSTVTISDGVSSMAVDGFAREAETKKGMDDSQITGAASSYARKYALNGMFLIDDTKDADATNDHGKGQDSKNAYKPTPTVDQIIKTISNAETPNALMEIGKKLKGTEFVNNQAVRDAYEKQKSKFA
jgi:hypothetical protein